LVLNYYNTFRSAAYDKVIAFERDTGKTHAKLTQHIIDFDKPESYQNLVVGDDSAPLEQQ
jgi:aromatic ring-opening dioxygenase LigB subunit